MGEPAKGGRNVERLSTTTSVADENLTARATKLAPAKRSALTPELKERKHQLETEIARLVKALADGHGTQSVTAAIGERERELRGVTETLLERHPNSIRVKLDELRTFAVSRLTDLRRLLEKPKNIHGARMLLADQIGKITLVPKEGEYLAEGSVDFFGDKGLRVSGAGGQS